MAGGEDDGRAEVPAGTGDGPTPCVGVPGMVPTSCVRRTELLELLEAAADVPLVVVSAPAGTGKTVAVAQWAQKVVGARVVWVAAEDGEPFTWSVVLDGLRSSDLPVPDWMVPVGGGLGPQRLRALAEVVAGANQRTILVLDGHELDSVPMAREVDAMLRRTRGRLQLVLVGRVDPVLLLHRYRLRDAVTELRTPELAFSDEEAARLLRLSGVALPPEAAHELNRKLAGWAAGLRFASRALAASTVGPRFVDTVVEQTADINEFLVGEVLDVEPPEVRGFLLDTCVTDAITADIVEAIGGAPALRTLTMLVDRRGFLEVVPGQPDRFQYFPFFRNLLLARLAYEDPGRLLQLRRLASAWYRTEERWTRSLAELAKVGDWEALCGQLVDDGLVGDLLLEDRGGPLSALVKQLPSDVDHPAAHLARACLALSQGVSGDQRCARELHLVGERLDGSGADPALLVSIAATHALRACLHGSDVEANHAVEEAERLLSGSDVRPARSGTLGLATVVLFARGVAALRCGDLARARTALAGAADAATHGSSAAFRADCLGRLALAEALHGSLETATGHAEEALGITGPPGSGPDHAPPSAHVALAWVGVERCDDDLLADQLAAARLTGALPADPFCATLAEAAEALLAHARAHTVPAMTRLEEAADGAARGNVWLSDLLRVEAARLSVTAGDTEHALGVLDTIRLPDRPEPQVLVATVLVRQGRSPDIEDWSAGVGAAPLSSQVGAHLVEATDAAHHRSQAQARTALTRALRLAAPERLRRPFRETDVSVGRLLERDTALVSRHEWLRDEGSRTRRSRHPSDEWVVVEPLTPKELEVLMHLAELLSTEEIAEKLFVSVNTVRTHIRNILHKLGVSRRNGAIRRARELGLLDGDRW